MPLPIPFSIIQSHRLAVKKYSGCFPDKLILIDSGQKSIPRSRNMSGSRVASLDSEISVVVPSVEEPHIRNYGIYFTFASAAFQNTAVT